MNRSNTQGGFIWGCFICLDIHGYLRPLRTRRRMRDVICEGDDSGLIDLFIHIYIIYIYNIYIIYIYIHFFKNNHASGRSFSGDRMVGYSKLDWIVASDWHPKFCLSDSDLSWKNSCCRSSIQWSKGQPLRTKPLLILVEYLAKTRLNSFPMSPRRRGEGDEGDWWGIMIPRLKESTVAGSPWGMRQLSLEQRGVE
jgi:hypothetical protein